MNTIRDRIIDLRRVRASELLPHPANWRRHPDVQREALRGMLEEIGYAGALLARQQEDGQLQLIDGHLRAETTPDHEVPVLVLDVTEEEAEKLLATIDPIGALATRDDAALRDLLDRVGTENTRVQSFLEGLREQLPPVSGEKMPLDPHPLPEGFADIRCGHVLDVLKTMADDLVHCVVTSPPYWGLRDYQLPPQVWGGEPACDHKWVGELTKIVAMSDKREDVHHSERDHLMDGERVSQRAFCQKCGAWRGALGLEPTPDLYVQHMVDVFREVRRVLRPDGTLWLNMGDAYASQGGPEPAQTKWQVDGASNTQNAGRSRTAGNLKPKDLVGLPWRVAFALQQDGWYLRSDIIWAKPNPMPESVTDRPTKAHEYVFLLAKTGRYYYDVEAIREVSVSDHPSGNGYKRDARLSYRDHDGPRGNDAQWQIGPARNRRTVWEIATQPYPEAHFATFPEALVEPCILAGTSERGCCPTCGAPWAREVDSPVAPSEVFTNTMDRDDPRVYRPRKDGQSRGAGQKYQNWRDAHPAVTTGWHPTCGHEAEPVPCTILDPFAGSGTALLVGKRLGRSVIGIELSEEYCKLISHRLAEVLPNTDVSHRTTGLKQVLSPRRDAARWHQNHGRGF